MTAFLPKSAEDLGKDTAIKAAAMAMVITGQSDAEVARLCNVTPNTVRQWKAEYGVADIQIMSLERRKEDLGDLLYEYLRASLRALVTQLELFSDLDWLRSQKAGELALLHGTIADRATQILSALQLEDRESVAGPEAKIIEAQARVAT